MREFFYYNTTDPLAEPRPMFTDVNDLIDVRNVQDKAERCEYLIIFEMSITEFNRLMKEA